MSEGRGAWTTRGKGSGLTQYGRVKGQARDGYIGYTQGMQPEEVLWYECVHAGVVALTKGIGSTEPGGVFTWATKKSVLEYQTANGLVVDGLVGQQTMKSILVPIIKRECAKEDIGPSWIYGLARQESALDPGAQGGLTPNDLGIWQFNTSDGIPTPEQAFDIDWACEAVCNRWKSAWIRYGGKGTELRIDCSIMQHRSPVAADHLYRTGEPYDDSARDYVASVRSLASDW